jgi:hypothetical protein
MDPQKEKVPCNRFFAKMLKQFSKYWEYLLKEILPFNLNVVPEFFDVSL